MTTYTVAWVPDTILTILPGTPAPEAIEAAIREEEEMHGERFDRDQVSIESGLVLTDEIEPWDDVIWKGTDGGVIADESNTRFAYIVRP